jgi:MYXO-CTERM domain-containing protein
MVEMLEAWEAAPDDPTTAMLDTIVARGDDVPDAWITFSRFNLATGANSGVLESHPYADLLDPPAIEESGKSIREENRFYPLATTYFRLDHSGGELWFGLEDAAPEVFFSVNPTEDGDEDSPVVDAVAEFWGDDPAPRSLGDLPKGAYFLWGTQPESARDSVVTKVCAGDEDAVAACLGLDAPDPDPDGDVTEDPVAEPAGGCGCSGTPANPAGLLAGVALSALARTRRRPRP